MNKTSHVILFILLSIAFFSCSKEAGDGGNSTIYGKIIAYNYNAEFTTLKGIYPAADEDVFIIYGNDHSYSERVRTSFEGIYEFKYLRKGDYTIYAYSKDSTLTLPSEMYAVIRKVKIDDNQQTVQVEDMKIFR
ncbi:MAG: hypothetical protein Q7U54_06485 [Bacteroidales bacterium]|nr:hypothetical protein [Bacteroidales bacterium]